MSTAENGSPKSYSGTTMMWTRGKEQVYGSYRNGVLYSILNNILLPFSPARFRLCGLRFTPCVFAVNDSNTAVSRCAAMSSKINY
uniref:Uncharacterized protein n=1 Tax=Kalanchoe fedtschenkoi TaxID=63787 RepID=A0A7N1A5L7_KALFE